MVERLVANEKVEGSNPFARSIMISLKFIMSDLSKKNVLLVMEIFHHLIQVKYINILKKVDGWDVKSNEDKSFYLIKDFKFKNFEESQNFVNKVGYIAEEENHHPDISFGWGYCKIKIFTHAIKGLQKVILF